MELLLGLLVSQLNTNIQKSRGFHPERKYLIESSLKWTELHEKVDTFRLECETTSKAISCVFSKTDLEIASSLRGEQ